MKKVICDKCGKEMDDGNDFMELKLPIKKQWIDDATNEVIKQVYPLRDVELCNDCLEKLAEHMNIRTEWIRLDRDISQRKGLLDVVKEVGCNYE